MVGGACLSRRAAGTFADAPIGVFDSGVGGLSVLLAIRRELPHERLLYFADSAHAPYGDRPFDFIAGRAEAITRFLLARGAKAIVVACNTATVVAVHAIRSWCPVPVVAVEPAIKPACLHTRSAVIGVLATSRTLASPAVATLCAAHANHAKILLTACPGLAEQVERAELASGATRALLHGYIAPLLAAGADTLVLGCTHYPFLMQAIRDITGPHVCIIDPAAAVARQLARRLGTDVALRRPGEATEDFFSSAAPERARSVVSALWGRQVKVRGFAI